MAKKDKDFGNDELVNYYTKAYEALDNETENDTYGSYVLSRVKGGQKTVFNKTQSEIRNFDMSFLDTIESVYPAITKIMRDPKKSLRYEQEVVAVEKARKTNSDTVRHLSSHTHLIKEITKEGDVIPSKVLTTYAEEELAIYENRFIKSLVKRMEMFLERRYEVMKVSLESFETERLSVQNEFLMSGQTVTVSLDVAIKNDLTTNVETTKEQYNRLLYIREMVQSLKGTDFMRALKNARDVLPPIMKTNILMHNPDFKLAYGLWLYLDRVDGIATNIDVKEKSYKYSANFDKDINEIMTLALTAFIKNRNIDGIYSSRKINTMKAPKPIENQSLELEMNLEADNNKLEDYSMNQVLLDQTAKFFEASMEGLQTSGQTYNESVRTVYRQMLDMVDQLYPKAFGISDDEFESADLYKQLEYARRQMMVAKIVKQAKQMALAKMGKEEKRIEKLIDKLEDKIKKSEAKERERLEKEAARIEAQRQAALERERAKEAKRKSLEKKAVEMAKAIERKLSDQRKAMEQANIEKATEQARMQPRLEARRNHLKEAREKEKGKWNEPNEGVSENAQQQAAPAEAAMPIRRRDDYDDLSDAELEALMNANDLLDDGSKPNPDEKPKEEAKPAATKKPAAKKAAPAPKKEAPKAEPKPDKDIADKDINDMSDEELEALIGMNSGDMNFNAADVAGDEPDETPKAKTLTKKSKEDFEAEKKAEEPKEEAKPKKPKGNKNNKEKGVSSELDDALASDSNTEKNDSQELKDIVDDIPDVVEIFPEQAEAEEEAEQKEFDDFLNSVPDKEEPKSDDVDDLLNSIPEKEEAPAEEKPEESSDVDDLLNSIPEKEPEPAKEESSGDEFADIVNSKPKKDDKDDDGSDDDFDNMSDEELEALMAQNDML